MRTFSVGQHDYDGKFLPSVHLLGGKYTLHIQMNDEDKLYQVILTQWHKPYDEESEQEQARDYVLLTNLGKEDNYKESLVSFVKFSGNIGDKNVEEVFLLFKASEIFDLLIDKAASNGLVDIIDDGRSFNLTKKAFNLVGLKTFKGLSQDTAMKKLVEILNSPENEEYGKEPAQ